METVLLVSRIEMVFVTFLALAIPLVFATFAGGHRKTLEGRLLMGFFALFGFSLATSTLTMLFGLTPWVIILRVIAYTAFSVLLCSVLWVIIRTQEIGYRARKR